MRAERARLWAYLFFLAWVFLVALPAIAGPDIIQSNDNNTQTSGDIVDKHDSLGLGLAISLGGVYAEDCYVSDQETIVVVGRQGWKLNRWCAANYYEAQGLVNVAAQLRCSIPAIAELSYPVDCVTTHLNVAPREQMSTILPELVNILVERQDALTAPLSDELSQLRQDLESHESERLASERRSQRAYEAKEAERQQIIQKTLDQLPKDGQ